MQHNNILCTLLSCAAIDQCAARFPLMRNNQWGFMGGGLGGSFPLSKQGTIATSRPVGRALSAYPSPFNQPPPFKNPGSATGNNVPLHMHIQNQSNGY